MFIRLVLLLLFGLCGYCGKLCIYILVDFELEFVFLGFFVLLVFIVYFRYFFFSCDYIFSVITGFNGVKCLVLVDIRFRLFFGNFRY